MSARIESPSATDVEALARNIGLRDRRALARAITLIESTRPDHRIAADQLIGALLAHSGGAIRVGISGPPGVGKSTLIERMGLMLCERGHRVAVLAVDPSSTVRGGSILGDKTRMAELGQRDDAFVRPSPSSGALGGVHDRSHEVVLLCEASGYDVILVETVGVGQSETAVAQLVDTVVVLLLPGAGDELQGIKKGLLEVADVLAVNKADGDNLAAARRARKDLRAALRLVRPQRADWAPPVSTCSALHGDGLEELWEQVCNHREVMKAGGVLEQRRRSQRVAAMWKALELGVMQRISSRPQTKRLADQLQRAVEQAEISPSAASIQLIDELFDATIDSAQ